MAETTKIEWADATVNPWWGCTKVSPACARCYAATLAARFGQAWGPGAPRTRKKGAEALARKLNRKAEREGRRLRVFAESMGDWLDHEVPTEWRVDLLEMIRSTPDLDWLLLSKRPESWSARLHEALGQAFAGPDGLATWIGSWLDGEAPANVWVGCTVEDQEHADRRIPELLAIPARVRFLSCEPLLGPLNLTRAGALMAHRGHQLIHWIIGGGESGRGARPTHPDWARGLRDDALEFGVPFFFKQWGEWAPGFDPRGEDGDWCPYVNPDGSRGDAAVSAMDGETWLNWCGEPQEGLAFVQRVGKARAGRLLDGRTWDELPEARP